MPRSPYDDIRIVETGTFCVNRWDRPRGLPTDSVLFSAHSDITVTSPA